MVYYPNINVNAPLSDAFQQAGLHVSFIEIKKTFVISKWAAVIVAIGSLTTMSATTLTSLIGQPRIFFQMAKDVIYIHIISTYLYIYLITSLSMISLYKETE
jgi:amino acid transporter